LTPNSRLSLEVWSVPHLQDVSDVPLRCYWLSYYSSVLITGE